MTHTLIANWKTAGGVEWRVSPGVSWCRAGYRVRIAATARIGDGASIGNGASIGDRASIGDGACIGAGCRVFTLADAIKHWRAKRKERPITLIVVESVAVKIARQHKLKRG